MARTKHTTQEQRDAARIKRENLKILSMTVKGMMAAGILSCATVNEGLMILYGRQGHNDLKTYSKWREEGFIVNKGEKSCMIWSRPINKMGRVDNESQDQSEVLEADSFAGYGVCHLYGRDQVHPI